MDLLRLQRTSLKLAVPFLLLLALPAQIFPQSQLDDKNAPARAIKVRTQLVLIPADVTDAQGNPVTNMKKEDFAVFANGKRQEIALFEHVVTNTNVMKPEAVPAGVFTNEVARSSGRVTIFVLDLLNSGLEEQRVARKELIDFLSKTMDTQEPLCLIAVDGNGPWMVHDFTTDPALLAEALGKVKQEMADKDMLPVSPEERMFRLAQGWNTRNMAANAAAEESRLQMLELEYGMQDLGVSRRIQLTLMSLMEIGNAFAGVPGRKSLIWATAGLPFDLGDPTVFQIGGSFERLGNQGYASLYEQAWRALNQANIAVYPLDVSALENPGYVNPATGEPLPQHVVLDMHVANLENLADVTGGRLCDRSMDAKKCFDEASNDSSDYYLLGIYDPDGPEKPGWRKLSVRTERAGLHIRARNGYFVGSSKRQPNDTQKLEMALYSPVDFTALPLSVRLTGQKPVGKPGTKRVSFVFTLPPGAVRVEPEETNQIALEFAAVAKDAKGNPAGIFRKVVDGKLTGTQIVQIREKGVLFGGEVQLQPGDYTLSFAVLDQVNDLLGSVSAAVKVE